MPIIICPIKLTQKTILVGQIFQNEASLWTYKNLNLVFFVAVHENLFENPYRFYIMLMAEKVERMGIKKMVYLLFIANMGRQSREEKFFRSLLCVFFVYV